MTSEHRVVCAQISSSRSSNRADGKHRTSRSSSVVYPEAQDEGKPKLFARQSFVVNGETEAMAETILEARKLAIGRRKSAVDIEASTKLSTSAKTTSSIGDGDEGVVIEVTNEQTLDLTSLKTRLNERRRSSAIDKLPPQLRTLMQQSDENGVQQKMEIPHITIPKYEEASERSDSSFGETSDERQSETPKGWYASVVQSLKARFTRLNPRRKVGWKLQNATRMIPKRHSSTPKTTKSCATVPITSAHNSPVGTHTKEMFFCSSPKAPTHSSLLLPQSELHWGKKLLILDLDETLVHSSFKPVPNPDYILDIQVDGVDYKVYVLKRPGVDSFLERVSKVYEVVIFTASLPPYANPLLDKLDPNGYITARLFREQCTFHEGYFVKDLNLLRHNFNLSDTIIVDNSPMAYMFQPENAIDCTSWLEDPLDEELYIIADFLEKTKTVQDVRDYVEYWREGAHILDVNTCY